MFDWVLNRALVKVQFVFSFTKEIVPYQKYINIGSVLTIEELQLSFNVIRYWDSCWRLIRDFLKISMKWKDKQHDTWLYWINLEILKALNKYLKACVTGKCRVSKMYFIVYSWKRVLLLRKAFLYLSYLHYPEQLFYNSNMCESRNK